MYDIEMIMKRVFKKEHAIVAKSKNIIVSNNWSDEESIAEYSQLLEAYQSLLFESSKVTKIGDINQKKLFEANIEIETQREKLYQLSVTDYLTGSYNRRFILEALSKEFLKSKRYSFSLSCILLDVDNFKSINDTYGHQTGDKALKLISEIIRDMIREVDVFGRYGGEEFLIILPNTVVFDAAVVAEKIREKISLTEFATVKGGDDPFFITLSLGIADTNTNNPKTEEDLLYFADTALYQAKDNNKNQYVIYS